MGTIEEQVTGYQNRLKQLAKRDYIYLFIGLIVVFLSGAFLYTQFHPGKSFLVFKAPLNEETFSKTNDIAHVIKQRNIDFISTSPSNMPNGLTNPNPTTKNVLTPPDNAGQISAIASGRVTYSGKTYTVKKGDSLETIALVVYGDKHAWVKLAEANGLMRNPDAIYEGMVLTIPR
jgi:nucleoid-associated protein YgaU